MKRKQAQTVLNPKSYTRFSIAMKKATLVLSLLAMMFVNAVAQKGGSEDQLIKDANQLFESGQYIKAFPLYSQLVSLYPQHPDYNYRFGACAIYSDQDKTKAIKYLTNATNKGVTDAMAWYYLGKAYHLNYEFKPAIKAYEEFIAKADSKLVEKMNPRRDIETCVYGSGLLSNIKDVVVINKTESDKENFFRYFNLEEIGGRILTVPAELKSKLDEKSKEPGVMHYPGNSTTIFYSSYGKDGSTGKDIYKALILPDGKFSSPEKLSGGVNTKYDEDFCFMHSDGKTLYFASKGHNSMGGYDIFKCEYNASSNSFGEAINLDFAINTPDDDIFYCVDSKNEKAYFASARSSDQGHMHVYNVMVQGIPLNVVYIKGEFINDISPDEKTAGMRIKNLMGGNNALSDATSDQYTGKYVIYAPKGGQYKLEVQTTHSPIIHQSVMDIPSFDHPVAIRQELRLVKENGVEKLIVNNYFEEIPNEDLAALAADMLRKKARLDVNATDDMMEMASSSAEPVVTMQKTMESAPVAAGFPEGTSLPQVASMMEADIADLEDFVSNADRKADIAYSYALKTQTESENKLRQAENLRQTAGNYGGQGHVDDLRESHRLSLEAAKLRRQSTNAMASAEALKTYRESENQRKEDLRQKLNSLNQAHTGNDVNAAFAQLQLEKDRQTSLRGGQVNPPMEEMKNKAKAKESEERASLGKLDRLHSDEKQIATDIKISEERMASAKKKADKENSEIEYATLKGKLDAKRREIFNETIRAEKLGKESADVKGQVEFYAILIEDKSDLGLKMDEKVALSEPERNTLKAKLREMDGRLDALEIKDPQTLALLGEMNKGTELTARVEGEKPELAQPNSTATALRSTKQAKLERYEGSGNIMLAGKRMVLNQEVNDVNTQIASLEKKPASNLSAEESSKLDDLKKYRTELKAEIAGQVIPSPAVSATDMDATCQIVDPEYKAKKQNIQTSSQNDLIKEMQYLGLKEATLEGLKNERQANALKAANESDLDKATQLASRDLQLEVAINSLEKDVYNSNSLKAAYESENKDIIENNAVIQDKLKNQVDLTETYLAVINAVEADKKSNLSSTSDPEEVEMIEKSLADLASEKTLAESRLQSYQNDLNLTLAASGPTPVNKLDTASKNTEQNLEDAVSNVEDSRYNFDTPTIKGDDEEESKSKAEKDSETVQQVFKPVKEEESIYAYETGSLDELVYKYPADSVQLRNRDKIIELQDNIFLIEAEIENEKNPLKQKKLDRDAEKLYLKKSLLETTNAENIAKMTRHEFDGVLADVQKLNAENKTKIDSRVMLKDELKSLFNKAKDEMEDAAILRKRAYPVVDDIEKNDFFRRAFAKEMYAISLLKQIEGIHENLDMMLQYDDQQLTALRYGKLEIFDEPKLDVVNTVAANPSETKSTAVAVNTPTTKTVMADGVAVDSKKVTSNSTGTKSGTSAKTTIVANTASNGSSATGNNSGSNTGTNAASNTATVRSSSTASSSNGAVAMAPKAELIDNTSIISSTKNADQLANSVMSNPSSGISNKEDLMNSKEFRDYTAMIEEASMLDGQRMNMIRERNKLVGENNTIADQIAALEVAKANAFTPEERAGLQKQIDKLAKDHDTNLQLIRMKDMEIAPLAERIKEINGNANNLYSSMSSGNITGAAANTSNSAASNVAANTSRSATVSSANSESASAARSTSDSGSLSAARASGGAYSAAEAESMLWNFPSVLEKDFFLITNRSAYTDSKPIPVDVEMPKGIYYKVQVGAFRNNIPQNLYDEFAPVSGESLSNGITRYTAGFFMSYDNADKTKFDIRKLGYSDAFVVAFRDGKRIPLYEAMGMTESDFQASVEREYVLGDGGKKPEANSGTTSATTGKTGDYYKKYPNAAKASQVEVMSGLFYTVQVGVYTKPVPASSLYNMSPLNSELTESKKIRYSTGAYTSMQDAVNKRAEAKAAGISDAFITAYYNGSRITLSEADRLLKVHGESIYLKK